MEGTQAVTKFRETLRKVYNILSYRDYLVKYYGSRFPGLLGRSLDIISKDLFALIEDKTPVSTPDEREVIKEVLETLAKSRCDSPLTKDLKEAFLLLAFNWNNQVAKSQEINQLIQTIRTGKQVTCQRSPQTLSVDQIIERLKWLANYQPPAFELSRHYLEILARTLREEKKITNRASQ